MMAFIGAVDGIKKRGQQCLRDLDEEDLRGSLGTGEPHCLCPQCSPCLFRGQLLDGPGQ